MEENEIRSNPYGNSDKARAAQQPPATQEQHVPRVQSKDVVVAKKKESKFDWFCNKMASIGSYILHEILIPSAIDTATEMAHSSIDIFARNETKSRRRDRSRGGYGAYYRRKDDRDREERLSSRDRDYEPWEGHVIEPKPGKTMQDAEEEAEDIINDMIDLCMDYGKVRVSDLMDLLGKSSDWRKGYDYLGWEKEDIRYFSKRRVRNGWLLEFPRANKLSRD